MMKLFYLFLFSCLLIVSELNAQRLLKATIDVNGKTEYVSYLHRRGATYVSSKDLAKALGGSSYYNSEAKKIEMKFRDYKLKVTAISQYYILINRKDNSQTTFQVPVSTLSVNNDVFIPVTYSLKYIGMALGNKLIFNNDEKHFSISTETVEQLRDENIPDPVIAENNQIILKPNPPKTDSPFDIFGMNIEEKTNGTLIRIKAKKKIRQYSSSIRENILYLFTAEATVDNSTLSKVKKAGLVRSFEIKNVKGNYQFEFKLKDGFSTSEAFQDPHSYELLITIHNKNLDQPVTNIEDINKWKFDVVVIDAGHGGKDPGALGVTRVKEKDVNLGIALKLGKLIETKMKDVEVVYTRKDDRFIELYKRGKIANENDGKLFISIHCNSLGRKNRKVRGHEVYLLRPGRTKEAIAIAEFENNVVQYEENPEIYQELTDENFILVSMAHSAYMRYSEKFADELNQQFVKDLKLPSRGVKQAGFYVLVGASMPGVLIETGFLSNKQDEKYLNSKAGQNQIANSIYEAIVKYREHYESDINEESL